MSGTCGLTAPYLHSSPLSQTSGGVVPAGTTPVAVVGTNMFHKGT